MTRMGPKHHQKRPSAPTTWPIPRKGEKFLPKIRPGPHKKEFSMPLAILLRDVLDKAQTMSEVKRILSSRKVMVDGRVRSDIKYPVGHMDIVKFEGLDEFYRVQIHTSNKLLPFPITEEETTYKVCRVIGKRNVKGGDTQISLHDGRNILLRKNDKNIDKIKGHHSLRIGVPSQEILDIFPLEEGARVMVTEGRHQGKIGTIREIEKRYGPRASEVILEDEADGDNFRTALDYVFVLGPNLELQR